MNCPKCGFEQPEGVECLRCGVVFSRYKGPIAPPPAGAPPIPMPPVPSVGSATPASPPLEARPVQAGTMVSPPPPPAQPTAAASGGTLYEGPPIPFADSTGGTAPPPPAGTVYSGQAAQVRVYKPLQVGDFLKESFAVYAANFFPFLILSLIALSPSFLLSAFATASKNPMVAALGPAFAGLTVGLFCQPLATAALTYGVFQQMRGAEASIAACLRIGFLALFPVLAVAICQGCIVGVGFILCVIPMFIFQAMYSVAIPVAIEERPGVFASLQRSSDLTQGYRWPIFGALFLLGLAGVGLSLGIAFVLGKKPGTPEAILISQGIGVFSTGISATASAVIYYRLRSAKESIDVDQIASVFG